MTTQKSFVKTYAVPIYFILTFAISWVCMALIIFPDTFPMSPDQVESVGPLTYVALLVGPSLAGLIMIAIVDGKAGYRDLSSRLLNWRVGIWWYVFALVAIPFLATVILFLLSLFSSEFIPALFTSDDMVNLVIMGCVTGLMVGFFEELGWTGFAIPHMRLRFNLFMTGIAVGMLWGAWHFLAFWELNTFVGVLPFTLLLMRLFAWLPPFRILMVWVHDKTNSLLLVVLLHASLVFTTLNLPSTELSAEHLVIWLGVWAIALWCVVAIVYKVTLKQQDG